MKIFNVNLNSLKCTDNIVNFLFTFDDKNGECTYEMSNCPICKQGKITYLKHDGICYTENCHMDFDSKVLSSIHKWVASNLILKSSISFNIKWD